MLYNSFLFFANLIGEEYNWVSFISCLNHEKDILLYVMTVNIGNLLISHLFFFLRMIQ